MSNLEFNKVAAAVLIAGITAMVTGYVAEGLYHGASHGDEKETRGYSIDVPEEAVVADGAQKPAGPVDIAPFLAKADAAAGQALMRKCTACHTFEKDGANGVGPNQWGLINRGIASHAGYSYSDALKALGDKSWTFQELSEFLKKPKTYAPGNKMAYIGMKDPQERANLMAHMNDTYMASPVPYPEVKEEKTSDAEAGSENSDPKAAKKAGDKPADKNDGEKKENTEKGCAVTIKKPEATKDSKTHAQ